MRAQTGSNSRITVIFATYGTCVINCYLLRMSDSDYSIKTFNNGGTVGALMLAHDWSKSPLGQPSQWPSPLRSVVSLMLGSNFPMFVAWGDELGFIYNDAYSVLLGNKHPAAIGARFQDIWSEIWDDIYPLVAAAMAGTSTFQENMPLTMNRKGFDEETWFTFTYTPVRDDDGKVVGMFCASTETTPQILAKRRADFRNKLNENMRIAGTSRAAIDVCCGLLGQEMNANFCAFGEIEHDAHCNIESTWTSSRHSSLKGRHNIADYGEDRISDLLSGQPVLIEDVKTDTRTSGTDAEKGYARLGCRATLDVPLVRDGKVQALLSIGMTEPHVWTQDEVAVASETVEIMWQAAERARAEEKLAESEQRYRTLFNSIDEGFCIIEFVDGPHGPLSDYVHIEANLAYAANAGIDDVTGKYVRAMVGDEAEEWIEIYRDVLLTGRPVRFERELVATGRHLELSSFRIEPAEKRQVAVLFKDVTPRKIAEKELVALNSELTMRIERAVAERGQALAQLHEAQKLETIGQLTGGVAHDFNNLLTPIVGALDILSRRPELEDRVRNLVDGGIQAAEKARTLVQRLLAFSRRQTLENKPVDIGHVVCGMQDLIARSIGPQIRLNVICPANTHIALVDPNQFELALLNLSVNARDAMPDGGELEIGVQSVAVHDHATLPDGDFICVRVSDTGSGMDAETLRRAIEPFFTTKGVGHGTGLGLSSVHGLAAQSDGLFELTSQPGRGTTALLWLPASQEHAVPAESRPVLVTTAIEDAPDSAEGRRTILLVDDEMLVRLGTAHMLQDIGYTVVEAASGRQALQILEGDTPVDALVTDYAMPDMTGDKLAQRALELRPHIKMLLVTGYASTDQELAMPLPRLEKPFGQEELDQAIGALFH